ncbi:hypothetical protein DYB35_012376 [Aphanomyces astaci]|uniref:Chromatin-remodeling ATPase INO80 n=1 Tax=Aphanomyces astaci TaxID=112090 RepID=A0A3R7AKS2_APHAT|nr:hypothetical protein DYB35_012376 [Aphanomyces astaci]
MARSSTRKALSGGNFMGMMNVLMQLRKVCNHPDLFEARPVLCPFDMAPLTVFISPAMDVHNKVGKATSTALAAMVQSPTSRLNNWLEIMLKVLCFVHKARTSAPTLVVGSTLSAGRVQDALHSKETNDQRQHLYFPDKRLIQFDCGKLQQLDRLLRELKRGSHRCLIFSQMSSMLNILEIFLNVHG